MPALPPENPDSAAEARGESPRNRSSDGAPEISEREVFALGALVDALRKCTGLGQVCEELAVRLADLARLDDCVVYVRHGNLLVQSAAHSVADYSSEASRTDDGNATADGEVGERGLLLERIALPLGSGVAGSAAVRRAPVYEPDIETGGELTPAGLSPRRSEYAVPMIHNGELIGVIDSQSALVHDFDGRCQTLMRAAADIAAVVVASHRNLDAGTSSNALSNVVAELAALPTFESEHYADGIALLVERTARVLQVSKVSVWLLEDQSLRLIDQYRLVDDEHHSEGELSADRLMWFANEGLHQGMLVIGDTLRDPRSTHLVTSDRPAEVTVSAIHAPIRSAGELRGILCLDVCDGQRQWVETEIAFAGAIADIAALGLISALKSKAEIALIQAQRLESLGRLAGGVAHDFNNLLTVINGGVSLLLQRKPSPAQQVGSEIDAEQERLLKMVEQAGEKAQKLTRQLLAFGKKQRLSMQVVDARELLAHGWQLAESALREDIQVIFDHPDQPCWVECDKDQLDQTILNLLMNAIDAMPLGGRLRLSVTAADNQIICRIEDSGAGVPESLRHRIFEPFFTTKGERGTGLGLAVGYGIVKQHGGDFRLGESEDRAYGGAVFEISLPAQPEPVFATGDIRVTEPNVSLQIAGKVLLVEDEQDVRFVVERMLTRLGFDAVVAKDGGDALRLLDERNIAVLVTDVVMPDVRGPELYALALKKQPDLKVLFMSGYSESSLIDVPADKEGVRYLSKPFALKALETALFEMFQIESERSPIMVEPLLPRK